MLNIRNGMIVKLTIRDKVKKIVDRTIRRGKFQKKATVALCNVKAMLDLGKKTDELFDYKKIIAGKKNYIVDEYYRANGFYGIGKAIRSYSGYNKKINACVEHGVYWGDFFLPFEAIDSGLNGLITFGQGREDAVSKKANVPIYQIGPYINYAHSLLSQAELKDIKQKWGKTLLVFPTHSVEEFEEDYDILSFINWIEKLKRQHEYNTILVSLYYKDILLGKAEEYEKRGYRVVTSGYLYDPLFLNRLRTFIELSDYGVSNSVGTHLCYCLALGKGYTIYDQQIEAKGYDGNNNVEYPKDPTGKVTNKIKELFSCYSEKPTKEQVEFVNYWCGLKIKLTPQEMFNLLKCLEKRS